MSIYHYEIIAPIKSTKKPFFNERGFLIIPNFNFKCRYYIECARYNPLKFEREYFILLGVEKFDNNCRKCRIDDYGRLNVKLHGELEDYVKKESIARGNIEFNYIESSDNYEVFQIR